MSAEFPPELLILRHGETAWNVAGRLQGALDSPLTANGQAQARAQGVLLRDMEAQHWAWVSSPQGRAMHTAQIARAVAQGPDITTDDRLVEITMGDWTGLHRSEIAEQAPHVFGTDGGMGWYDHAPGGEGLQGVAARVASFVQGCRQPTVLFTHGITSRILRCILLGRPVGDFDKLEGGQGVAFHFAQGSVTKRG